MSSVTFNGTSLTFAGETQFLEAGGEYQNVEVYVLVAPPVTTANIVVTMLGTPTRGSAVGLSFFGVRQTTPIEATGSTSGTLVGAVDTFSATVTTLTANALVAAFAYTSAGTATLGAGPIERDNVDVGSDRSVSATQLVTSPASTSATWTLGTLTQRYAALAVSIAPFTPTRRNEARIVSVPGAGANTLFTISQNPVGKFIVGSQ